MSDYMSEGSVAACFLKFAGEPVPSPFGFVLQERALYTPEPDVHYLSDPTPPTLKEKLRNILADLSLNGHQSVLVQYWAATKAGGPFLLATTDQPYRFYGTDKGLKVYHKGCLHHKLYVHHRTGVHVGLPGLAFKKGTCQQTQDVHDYPEDQRPPCEDGSIFSRKWASFVVPVIQADECFGVLEIVINEQTRSCDSYIAEVQKALTKEGFQSSIQIKPPTEPFVPEPRQRVTTSCKFNSYKDLVPSLGLPKDKAMKMAERKHSLDKTITKNTFGSAHKTAGIPYWACVSNRASSSAPKTRISQTPYIPKQSTKASHTPKTGIDPTSFIQKKNLKCYRDRKIRELVPKDDRVVEITNEIGHLFRRDITRLPLNALRECLTSSFGMLSAAENNGFPEIPREVLMTPRLEVTGLDLQYAQVNQLSSNEDFGFEVTGLDLQYAQVNQLSSNEDFGFEVTGLEHQDADLMDDKELDRHLALAFPEYFPSENQHHDHNGMIYQHTGDTSRQDSVETTFATTNAASAGDEEMQWMLDIDFDVSKY